MPKRDQTQPELALQRRRLVVHLRPVLGAFSTVAEASGATLERRLREARAAVLDEPSLALGAAWTALEGELSPWAVTDHSVEACLVAGLALARLGQLPAGQDLIRQSRREAGTLQALPDLTSLAVLRGQAQALAADGQLERATVYTSRGLARLGPANRSLAAVALALEESALAKALGIVRLGAKRAHLAQELTAEGPWSGLHDRVLAWLAICLSDVGDLETLEVIQSLILTRGGGDPSAAPFRLWAQGRAAALQGNLELARTTLAAAVGELGKQTQVVEHRLATLDLAALSLALGEERRAVALASTVLPEIGGRPQRAFTAIEDAAVRAKIEATPFFGRLRDADLAPPLGPS